MRRALLAATLAVLAAAPDALAATPATARLTACTRALDQEERMASFAGDMRSVPGASRLQVKFVLHARTAEERRWVKVVAPGFGTWNSSAPGVGRYVYTKTVESLLAPAAYRTVVRFRWVTAGGRTLLRARRRSRVCRQPDLRPDLVAQRVTRAGDGYEVTLANAGRSAAHSFTVTIEIDGHVHHLAHVDRLGPRETVRLRGVGPACRAGTNLVVRVDAAQAVDEADEGANSLSQACPMAPGQ